MVCTWEARLSGSPGDECTVRYMEAGPCRKPHCLQLGAHRPTAYRGLKIGSLKSQIALLICERRCINSLVTKLTQRRSWLIRHRETFVILGVQVQIFASS